MTEKGRWRGRKILCLASSRYRNRHTEWRYTAEASKIVEDLSIFEQEVSSQYLGRSLFFIP